MDKIWYRNPSKSEVIGRCGGDKKPNDDAEPTKVSTQGRVQDFSPGGRCKFCNGGVHNYRNTITLHIQADISRFCFNKRYRFQLI